MLDDKLKEIKVKCYDGGHYLNDSTLSDENIAQIKQALAEEGYEKSMRTVRLDQITEPSVDYDKPPKERFGMPISNLMTGQEWLERFKTELLKADRPYVDPNSDDWLVSLVNTIEAAKKASLFKGEIDE